MNENHVAQTKSNGPTPQKRRSDAKDVAYLKLLASIVQRPFAEVVTAVSGNFGAPTPQAS